MEGGVCSRAEEPLALRRGLQDGADCVWGRGAGAVISRRLKIHLSGALKVKDRADRVWGRGAGAVLLRRLKVRLLRRLKVT